MKKYIIGLILLCSPFHSFAGNLLFENPMWNDISLNGTQDGSIITNLRIRGNDKSANAYCLEKGLYFITYTSFDDGTNIDTALYNQNLLTWKKSLNDRYIKTIICFENTVSLPPPTSGTGFIINLELGGLGVDSIPLVGDRYLGSINQGKVFIDYNLLIEILIDFVLMVFFLFLFYKFIMFIKYLVFGL